MNSFAFIIHPLDINDIYRWEKGARGKNIQLVEKMLEWTPPFKLSKIKGIRSATGAEVEGFFITCPILPKQFFTGDGSKVIDKIVIAANMAADLGAGIVGLGALTAVVGNGGRDVAERVKIAVTTGNSYTVATAIEGACRAAEILEIDLRSATAAVVGATGSVGEVCCHILSRKVAKVNVIGRDPEKLKAVGNRLKSNPEAVASIAVSTEVDGPLGESDVVITVTSASSEIIVDPAILKTGSVICDVARPRDVSKIVAEKRDDVLVIEGGMVSVPGNPDFGYDFGFPKGTSYACMAETMMLSLEGRMENYSIGKDITLSQVDETSEWASKHGFKLAGFRSFERAVTDKKIEEVKRKRMHDC